MKRKLKTIAYVLTLLFTTYSFSQALDYKKNRIAVSADGNNQPEKNPQDGFSTADPDDWGGTPAALAMIANEGLQNKLVHFSYNNFMSSPKHTTAKNEMAIGVNRAIKEWGFDVNCFFDVPENKTAAINHLANELKKSTVSDPLYFIHMGPAEFLYHAVKKTIDDGKIDALSNVYIISHSGYNDNYKRKTTHHSMNETRKLSGGRLKYKKIQDQNGCENPTVLWCSGKDSMPFLWIKNHPSPKFNWLYDRFLQHPWKKGFDISDAGMVWYLFKGDASGNLSKFEKAIKNNSVFEVNRDTTNIQTAQESSFRLSLNGVKDFEIFKINGFVVAYKDISRNAVAVDASLYPNQFAAIQKKFSGKTGVYNVSLTTLTEIDGESTYRFKVNGKLIGEFENPETKVDMKEYCYTFKNISIKKGDIFQIESNAHSNHEIPEGKAFAFARGRWRAIDFYCVER